MKQVEQKIILIISFAGQIGSLARIKSKLQ